ncbi:MAG: 50S ribosomal protein L32 [Alphaproteobacteria bacterium]|nr:50S ribosomal protein L32 [Alphaproteobacteria bacterium]
MAVPKKKISKSRRGMRRAHDALKVPMNFMECQECGELKRSHHICVRCGFYRDQKIIETGS